MTSQVRAWSTGSATTGGLRLSAGNETDDYGWKKFRSSETSDDPFITFSYNRKPNQGAAPSVAGGNSYTPPGGTLAVYTASTSPVLSTVASDPDQNRWKGRIQVHTSTAGTSASLIDECHTSFADSGKAASCTFPGTLVNNTEVFARAAVVDDLGLWNGTWSPWTTIRVAASAPAAPVISCPAPFVDGYWAAEPAAANVECTVSAPGTGFSAPVNIRVEDSGVLLGEYPIAPSSDPNVAKASFTIAKTTGTHTITAVASTPALKSATAPRFELGFGLATLESPADGVTTSGTVPVAGALQKPATGTPQAIVQYRLAGAESASADWVDANALSLTTSGGTVRATGSWNVAAVTGTNINARTPTTLQMRVCVYTSTPNVCQSTSIPRTLVRVPNAFGNGFPVDDSASVAQVALFTGEHALSASDVSVGVLDVSRSYSSLDGDGTLADSVRGIFGPGWTADLGSLSGMAGWTFNDATHASGTVSLTDPDSGTVLVWAHPSGKRATYARTSGEAVYEPVTAETYETEIRLVLKTAAGVPGGEKFEATEYDGTVTTWVPTTSTLSTSAVNTWTPHEVIDASDTGQARTYYFPSTQAGMSDRVGRIVNVPVGKTTADCPGGGTWTSAARGCTRLDVTYGTSAGSGEVAKQVRSISATVWDPATSALSTTTMASYIYDGDKRLTQVTDERTGLVTTYAWVGSTTRLATVTDPGLAPFRFWYDGQKISMITRDDPSVSSWNPAALSSPPAGSTALARYHYNLPVDGNGTALPDLDETQTGAWFQKAAPVAGYGVFGPDYAWDGNASVARPANGSNDWRHASIQYATSDGYTVNTASFGAGRWLVNASDYDSEGRVVRELDAGAISAITDTSASESAAEVDATSTQTVYDASGNVIQVIDPRRDSLANFVSYQGLRPVTKTTYDQGAPNGNVNPATDQAYNLPTRVAVLGRDVGGNDVGMVTDTRTGYAPIEAGDKSGWETGQPTTTTIKEVFFPNVLNDITSTTRYDDRGRVIEVRQPKADSGSHAGTTKNLYYTTGAHPSDGECGNRPEWESLVCKVGPAAGVGGDTLPTSVTTYDRWGQVATVTETSSKAGTPATRVTTTTYDAKDRVDTVTVTSTIPGSVSAAGSKSLYDDATGLSTGTKTIGTSIQVSKVFDGWGRQKSYTNAQGGVTTTTYDGAGRVGSVTDPTGTTTYAYDGTDAAGKSEHRGLVTGQTITRGAGQGMLTYAAAYDVDGNLVRQSMPGGIGLVNSYDAAGNLVEMTYTGQVTPVTEEVDPDTGVTTWTPGAPQPDQPWLSWSRRYNIAGQVAAEWNGAGAAFDGTPGVTDPNEIGAPSVGEGLAADKRYIYDYAGRLTRVDDRTAALTGITLDPDTGGDPQAPCTRREYSFDKNGNRTKTKVSSTSGGNCFYAGLDTETDYTYDALDRPLKAGDGSDYVYDAFGRQTVIPEADAPIAGAGDIDITYFDDDLAQSIAQAGVTTTFGLDPEGRRLTQTTAGGASSSALARHYGDDSDNPAWTMDQDGLITRMVSGIAPGLGATIDQTGAVSMVLVSPHGDAVTNVAIPAGQAGSTPAVSIDGWSDWDEYGNAKSGSQPASGYGWLGQHERYAAEATAGLTLMGVRLYNPVRGAFTSTDPVPGGNTTAYTYPQDPINSYDLSGEWSIKKAWKKVKSGAKKAAKFVWKHRNKIAFAACVVGGFLVCAGAGLAAGFGNSWKNGKFSRKTMLREAAWAIGGAGVGKGLSSISKAVTGRKRHWSIYKANVGLGFVQVVARQPPPKKR